LYEANKRLVQELMRVKSALDIYGLIGLNASRIEVGKKFFGHVQDQSLRVVALGFDKVFERESEDDGKIKNELCSISGIFRESKMVPIQQPEAWKILVKKYGVEPSSDWKADVQAVLAKQRPIVAAAMQKIAAVRNTHIAHLAQSPTQSNLPSIAEFEGLLNFVFDFHSFVTKGFLGSNAHDVLNDTQVKGSLTRVLEKTGVTSVVSAFKD
jgi:hypothetical protein